MQQNICQYHIFKTGRVSRTFGSSEQIRTINRHRFAVHQQFNDRQTNQQCVLKSEIAQCTTEQL